MTPIPANIQQNTHLANLLRQPVLDKNPRVSHFNTLPFASSFLFLALFLCSLSSFFFLFICGLLDCSLVNFFFLEFCYFSFKRCALIIKIYTQLCLLFQ